MNDMTTMLLTMIAAGGGESHGDGHSINWIQMVSLFANFAIFFGFLYYKLRPTVGTSLKARRETMAKELNEAREKQREAEAQLAAYRDKLNNLESEVQRIVAAYEAEARADAKRLEEDTEKALARLERESDFTIRQEIRKAEKTLRRATVDATMERAEAIVRKRITTADHRRLADQYVGRIEPGS